MNSEKLKKIDNKFDVIVVGAGFAGLYALHRLRGEGLKVKVIEKGSDLGGTWYWNKYPGCRCDVESLEYSFSFCEELQQEWEWPEKYSAQSDILNYANFVAKKFDLRKDILFDTKVIAASFTETENYWKIETDSGCIFQCNFCVLASGNLSEPQMPNFAGLDSFEGNWYHTGLWPINKVDFSGKRVGLIGTGSSGIQTAPEVAKQASELFVFQRTANFSLPGRNHDSDPDTVKNHKSQYRQRRIAALETPFGIGGYPPPTQSALEVTDEERDRIFEEKWQEGGTISFLYSFTDLLNNKESNEFASEFVRRKIREKVNDKETAELLCPKTHPIGTKRLVLDNGYYEIFNQPHVNLVDISKNGIKEITKNGVVTNSTEYKVDALIFAMGFDAMTGSIKNINICNHKGEYLSDKWQYGPLTYLGLMTAGFPNIFFVTGPQSPGVKSQMILSIEQHVDWISDCIKYMKSNGNKMINPQKKSEELWVKHVADVANDSLYPMGNSWYQGANIKGKTRVFMPYVGGFQKYRAKLNAVVSARYEGFDFY